MKFTIADFLLIVGFAMMVTPVFFINLLVGTFVTGIVLMLIALAIGKPDKPE